MMWVFSVWCVMMVACVSPGCSQPVLNAEQLQTIMPQILNNYGNRIRGQYSLAISIPWNRRTQQWQFQTVFTADPAARISTDVTAGRVYSGTYVVAAKVQERDGTGSQHTEFRVLAESHRNTQNRMVTSVQSLQGRDLLVFYTVNSPCWTTCTVNGHRESILEKIKVVTDWRQYGVVFTQAFLPRGTVNQTPQQVKDVEASRRASLSRLAGSLRGPASGINGINHIYRCLRGTECYRCARNEIHVYSRCVTQDGTEIVRDTRPRPTVDDDGWTNTR